jgi:formyltetrahydrofolate hydrolase
MARDHEFFLTLSCPPTKGIVHAAAGLPFQAGRNIFETLVLR